MVQRKYAPTGGEVPGNGQAPGIGDTHRQLPTVNNKPSLFGTTPHQGIIFSPEVPVLVGIYLGGGNTSPNLIFFSHQTKKNTQKPPLGSFVGGIFS